MWKSSGIRLDGKPEVGRCKTVHAFKGDQYRTLHALQEGQYGSVHSHQEGQYGSVHALQEGQYGIFAPSFTPNFTHNFTSNFTSVFTSSFNPNLTTNLLHHDKGNEICVSDVVFFSAAKQLAYSSQPMEPAGKDQHLECLHQSITYPSTNIDKPCLTLQISWPLHKHVIRISLGLRSREIPRSSPASPWNTPSIRPLLFGLTHSSVAGPQPP